MPLAPGQIINNRYRIVKELGHGGMAAVYKAWDMNLNAPCAVKENKKLLPAEQAQFAKEARLLFNLKHPNLPSVHDLITLPGVGQFLVMDFIEGKDLAEMVTARGILPETEAVAYITQVCDALTYLHNQDPKVIHRDIKPSNIKVTPQGQIFLVDFGIAKTGESGEPTTDAARGITPGYSPPEQYGHPRLMLAPISTLWVLLCMISSPVRNHLTALTGLSASRSCHHASLMQRYNQHWKPSLLDQCNFNLWIDTNRQPSLNRQSSDMHMEQRLGYPRNIGNG